MDHLFQTLLTSVDENDLKPEKALEKSQRESPSPLVVQKQMLQ